MAYTALYRVAVSLLSMARSSRPSARLIDGPVTVARALQLLPERADRFGLLVDPVAGSVNTRPQRRG